MPIQELKTIENVLIYYGRHANHYHVHEYLLFNSSSSCKYTGYSHVLYQHTLGAELIYQSQTSSVYYFFDSRETELTQKYEYGDSRTGRSSSLCFR